MHGCSTVDVDMGILETELPTVNVEKQDSLKRQLLK